MKKEEIKELSIPELKASIEAAEKAGFIIGVISKIKFDTFFKIGNG